MGPAGWAVTTGRTMRPPGRGENGRGAQLIFSRHAKVMDRLDAMTAFALTVDAGGLSAAARKLGRSPASITRAVASLEEHLGVELLRRTTRSMNLTEAGERYLAVCRRVLAELAEAEPFARGAATTPRGTLTVTAPASFGARHVRPVVDAYLAAYPDVRARLLLLDRVVNLIEEGIDAAVRIASMPDSSLLAIKVGEVHRVVCASPAYCERRGRPDEPRQLADHACVAFTAVTPGDTWTFRAPPSGGPSRRVKVRPAPLGEQRRGRHRVGRRRARRHVRALLPGGHRAPGRPPRAPPRGVRARAPARAPGLPRRQHRRRQGARVRRPRSPAPARCARAGLSQRSTITPRRRLLRDGARFPARASAGRTRRARAWCSPCRRRRGRP